MSKFGEIESYFGVTHEYVLSSTRQGVFFRRFDSKEDVFLRALSVVTAPLLCMLGSPFCAILSCIWGLGALITVIISNREEALLYAKDAKTMMMIAFFRFPIQAVLSPFVNFVDFVGSIVTTAIHEHNKPAAMGL